MARAKPVETKAVANYDDRLAQLAKKATMQEASVSGGAFISTKGGQFSIGGNVVPEGKLRCVVLDSVNENAFYGEYEYDPNNPASPVCFSLGRGEPEDGPHEKSEDPQAEACLGCPQNQFNTAAKGRGKACKNIRRLALITEDGLEDIESSTVAFLKVPVTSLKAWASYVNNLDTSLHKPPLAVVTEISIFSDPDTQFKLSFRMVEPIEDADVLTALLDKMDACQKDLTQPYQPNSERGAAPPQKNARGRAAVNAGAAPKGSPAKFSRR